MAEQETDRFLGDLLRELRTARGLSVKRLSALADVARKTIDNAEKGQNVSVFLLKRLLRVLGVEEVTIRVSGPHSAREADGASVAAVQSVASEIRRTLLQAVRGLDRLDAIAGVPHDLNRQAETLIQAFSNYVLTVDDAEELATLEETIMRRSVPPTRRAATARPERRRKAGA